MRQLEANPINSTCFQPDQKVVLKHLPSSSSCTTFRPSLVFPLHEQQKSLRTLQKFSQDGSLGEYFFKKIKNIKLTFSRNDVQPRKNFADRSNSQKSLDLTKTLQQQVQQAFRHRAHSGQLQFCSQFQSGNLQYVFEVGNKQYEMVLHNDTNSKGYTQWFCFAVRGMKASTKYSFSLINLQQHQSEVKSSSLFQKGLKPSSYSIVQSEKSGRRWVRVSEEEKYVQNNIKRPFSQGPVQYFYTLKFCYKNIHQNDIVIFSHTLPYPLTKHLRFLSKIQRPFLNSKLYQKKIIGKTHLGLDLQMLFFYTKEKTNDAVLILARQHPGQTPGSFVMEGVLEFLFIDSSISEKLRTLYNFIIVPIVNPDGIILGNNRCNLAGVDLNRKWSRPDKRSVEIQFLKRQCETLKKRFKLKYIFDLHGHSKKLFFLQHKLAAVAYSNLPLLGISQVQVHFFQGLSLLELSGEEIDGASGAVPYFKVPEELHSLNLLLRLQLRFKGQDMRQIGANLLLGLFQLTRYSKTSFNLVRSLMLKSIQADNKENLQLSPNHPEYSQSQPSKDEIKLTEDVSLILPVFPSKQKMRSSKLRCCRSQQQPLRREARCERKTRVEQSRPQKAVISESKSVQTQLRYRDIDLRKLITIESLSRSGLPVRVIKKNQYMLKSR